MKLTHANSDKQVGASLLANTPRASPSSRNRLLCQLKQPRCAHPTADTHGNHHKPGATTTAF